MDGTIERFLGIQLMTEINLDVSQDSGFVTQKPFLKNDAQSVIVATTTNQNKITYTHSHHPIY
jgi:hypothetical protein